MKQHAFLEWFYGWIFFPEKGSWKEPRWVYDKKKIRDPQICMICGWSKDHPLHR